MTIAAQAEMTDAQLAELHGDDSKWSIARWRDERSKGETDLDYIDWRADKRWCSFHA
jgi:hypothetical protein